jgi:hypothetical protein
MAALLAICTMILHLHDGSRTTIHCGLPSLSEVCSNNGEVSRLMLRIGRDSQH